MTALEKNAEYSALVHPEQSVLFLPESGMHNPLESVFQQANSLEHCTSKTAFCTGHISKHTILNTMTSKL